MCGVGLGEGPQVAMGLQARLPQSPGDGVCLSDIVQVVNTPLRRECRNGVTHPRIRGIYKLLFNKWPLWQVPQG